MPSSSRGIAGEKERTDALLSYEAKWISTSTPYTTSGLDQGSLAAAVGATSAPGECSHSLLLLYQVCFFYEACRRLCSRRSANPPSVSHSGCSSSAHSTPNIWSTSSLLGAIFETPAWNGGAFMKTLVISHFV